MAAFGASESSPSREPKPLRSCFREGTLLPRGGPKRGRRIGDSLGAVRFTAAAADPRHIFHVQDGFEARQILARPGALGLSISENDPLLRAVDRRSRGGGCARGAISSEMQRFEPDLAPQASFSMVFGGNRCDRRSDGGGGVMGQRPEATDEARGRHGGTAYVEGPEAAHRDRGSVHVVVVAAGGAASRGGGGLRRKFPVDAVAVDAVGIAAPRWEEGGRKRQLAAVGQSPLVPVVPFRRGGGRRRDAVTASMRIRSVARAQRQVLQRMRV
mmetsp:Transcript_18603/g.43001  ORF Transcript_18603/g.43001 Transcript_18603/m.43001 type:complete len:271 (+) Transcript_18603:77-889(+)